MRVGDSMVPLLPCAKRLPCAVIMSWPAAAASTGTPRVHIFTGASRWAADPAGGWRSDKEASSDFQLIAGTNRDLAMSVRDGRFREDLMARLDLWTFALPGLSERREDIEPNIEFERQRHARTTGDTVTFNKEARGRYLRFAISPDACWPANFRDLCVSITRMATLAPRGRITEEIVADEIERLELKWSAKERAAGEDVLQSLLEKEAIDAIDPFDRVQLAHVIETCHSCRSLSDAGRQLFAASRKAKTSSNASDRLKKYLSRFGLTWAGVTAECAALGSSKASRYL